MGLIPASILVLVGMGVLFALVLAYASTRLAVKKSEKVEQLYEALPQLDCGACGFASCEAYAEALAKGGTKVGLCRPGGRPVAQAVADLLGVRLDFEPAEERAFVHCRGGNVRAKDAYLYQGVQTCAAASQVHGGQKVCKYGCMGFGDCAAVCPVDAITMSDERLPVIDRLKCISCGMCVEACPKDIIELLPLSAPVYLACCSDDRGAAVKRACSVGCIACRICVKECGEEAISMDGNLPIMHYGEPHEFEPAFEKCPMACFVKIVEGQEVAREEGAVPASR